MGNNPREKAIYMSGFTLGAGFGLVLLAGIGLTGSGAQDSGVTFSGLFIGGILIVVSFVWRRRANKSNQSTQQAQPQVPVS